MGNKQGNKKENIKNKNNEDIRDKKIENKKSIQDKKIKNENIQVKKIIKENKTKIGTKASLIKRLKEDKFSKILKIKKKFVNKYFTKKIITKFYCI